MKHSFIKLRDFFPRTFRTVRNFAVLLKCENRRKVFWYEKYCEKAFFRHSNYENNKLTFSRSRIRYFIKLKATVSRHEHERNVFSNPGAIWELLYSEILILHLGMNMLKFFFCKNNVKFCSLESIFLIFCT